MRPLDTDMLRAECDSVAASIALGGAPTFRAQEKIEGRCPSGSRPGTWSLDPDLVMADLVTVCKGPRPLPGGGAEPRNWPE